MIEAMRRGYADRARHLGDPDFVAIPSHLTKKDYAKKLAAGIDLAKATPSAAVAPEIILDGEGESTTHFSVVDRDGMAVSNTTTLENSYGNRVVVRGAGYILNNEMTDFNPKPGSTTRGGRIGTKANLIAPGKRMLSSMTPVIVVKDGKPVLVTGSPGGRTIINTVLCVVVNVVDFEMPVEQAVSAPRLHHQWFPDAARFEGVKQHPELVAKSEGARPRGDPGTPGRRPHDLDRPEDRLSNRRRGPAAGWESAGGVTSEDLPPQPMLAREFHDSRSESDVLDPQAQRLENRHVLRRLAAGITPDHEWRQFLDVGPAKYAGIKGFHEIARLQFRLLLAIDDRESGPPKDLGIDFGFRMEVRTDHIEVLALPHPLPQQDRLARGCRGDDDVEPPRRLLGLLDGNHLDAGFPSHLLRRTRPGDRHRGRRRGSA